MTALTEQEMEELQNYLAPISKWMREIVDYFVTIEQREPNAEELKDMLTQIDSLHPIGRDYLLSLMIRSIIVLNRAVIGYQNHSFFEGVSLQTGVIF